MSKVFELAKELQGQGYRIVPLSPQRTPLVKAWQDPALEVDLDQYSHCKAFGFALPEDILVVDVDLHSEDANGFDSLEALSRHIRLDIRGLSLCQVETARQGRHIYFKIPKGLKIRNSIPEFSKGLEFKSRGRYVLLPYSEAETGTYEPLEPYELENLPQAPFELIKLITSVHDEIKVKDVTLYTNVETAAVDFNQYIKQLKIADKVTEGERNNKLFEYASWAYDYGIDLLQAQDVLTHFNSKKVIPPLSDDEVYGIVERAYSNAKNDFGCRAISKVFGAIESPNAEETVNMQWTGELVTNKDNKIDSNKWAYKNASVFLRNHMDFAGKLAFNNFSNSICWVRPPHWHESDQTRGCDYDLGVPYKDIDVLKIRNILNEHEFTPSKQDIVDAINDVAHDRPFNPVIQYFNSLPKWDGVDRLSSFLHDYCGVAQTEFASAAGRCLFIAIVARQYLANCKFDQMVVFAGGEGLRKSTFIEAMAINPEWYTDSLGPVESKETVFAMQSKLIIEDSEISIFSTKDKEARKAFLSRKTDRVRVPYAVTAEDFPRRCVILGTTNKDKFLIDETGERRIWPFLVHKMDIELLRKNLKMLYAEAIERFNRGEKWYFDTDHLVQVAREAQKEFFDSDPWEVKIEAFLNGRDKVTVMDIWEECFMKIDTDLDNKNKRRIGSILRHLGYRNVTIRIGKKSVNGWKRE